MSNDIPLSEELAKLRGATVTMWRYRPSLQVLTLRFEHPDRTGNTHLVCKGCHRIEAPTHWLDAHVEVATLEGEWLLLIDQRAPARIQCRLAGVMHDVEPNYWRNRPPSSAS